MTYYDILEVNESASPEVIHMAWRTLAKKYHPDTFNGDRSEAEELTKQLNVAHDILSDPIKRKEYDRFLADQRNRAYTTPPQEDVPSSSKSRKTSFFTKAMIVVGLVAIVCFVLSFANNKPPRTAADSLKNSIMPTEQPRILKPKMNGGSKSELLGLWVRTDYNDSDKTKALLEGLDFFSEEIDLIDLDSLAFQNTFCFTENNWYYIGYDPSVCMDYARSFFQSAFNDLYLGRHQLSNVYEVNLDRMTQEEFLDFYCYLYDTESYDSLVESLATAVFQENALTYNSIDEGTYTISDNKLSFRSYIEGETILSEFNVQASSLVMEGSRFRYEFSRGALPDNVVGVRTISLDSAFEAEYILSLWKNGPATEGTMIQYMNEHGSTQGGGQLYIIKPGEFVDEISDWCFHPNRTIGDYTIIENPYGFSICYISLLPH